MTQPLPLPPLPLPPGAVTRRRPLGPLVHVERDPVAAALGAPAWQAQGARRIEALVRAPGTDLAASLEHLAGALASLVSSGTAATSAGGATGHPGVQLLLLARPALPSVTACLRIQGVGETPRAAHDRVVAALAELDQVLDGCPALRAAQIPPQGLLPALAHGRLALPEPERLWIEGLPSALVPPVREPGGPRGLAEVLRLLLAQAGPCAAIATLRRVAAPPEARTAAARCSAAYARVRSLLEGLDATVDQDRQRIHRYPEDLAALEAVAPRLRAGAEELAMLAGHAVALRVVVAGAAPPSGPLLRAVQAAWLGVRAVAWRELGPDQVALVSRGPLPALSCPVEGGPDDAGPAGLATESLALHLPAALAASALSLPAPADDQGWPGLPVDPAPVRPLPLCLAGATGTLLGLADMQHQPRSVRIADPDLARHLYACGKTGVGKSTLLRCLALDIARQGGGLGVVDPHGDLVDDLAALISPHRPVVVFDPTRSDGPGLDPMAHDGSPAGIERVCEELSAMMFRLYAVDQMGPMFDRYSRALLLPLLASRGSLADLSRVAHDEAFRRKALGTLDPRDPLHAEVLRFWRDEFPSWDSHHSAEMHTYVLSKYDGLVRSSVLRRACDPTRPQLDVARIADHGGVLLARLPEGRLGAVSAWFMGMLLVARLQDAIFARSRQAAADRRPFTLVLDEFHHFLGGGGFGYSGQDRTLAPLLSEARKFGLRLVLANQYVAQLDDGTREAVLGNVGSLVAFRVGGRDAELLGRELGVDPVELREQPLYRAAARLLVGGSPAPVFTLRTAPPEPASGV